MDMGLRNKGHVRCDMFCPRVTAVTLGWWLVIGRLDSLGMNYYFLAPNLAQRLCSHSEFTAFRVRSWALKDIGVGS